MSPTYSLTLVLAVTLFLAATSLADDHRKYPLTGDLKSQSNHPPWIVFQNEHRKPATPRKGGGNIGHVQVNKYDPKYKGGGNIGHEEAVDKKPIHKPVGPHDPHVNPEELIYKPKPKPGHTDEEAVNKKSIHKPVGPHDPHVNREELIHKPKPKPGHTDVFVETTKDKGKDKRRGGHVNEEIAKGKGKVKPSTGS